MNISNRSCCVVGCSSTEKSSAASNIKFYRFPGRKWEKKRKEMWIKAVNRENPDGSLWQCSENSRICSVHFVGGEKSNIERHPAYNPTIFPDKYKRKPKTMSDVARFQRSANRRLAKETKDAPKETEEGPKETRDFMCVSDSDVTSVRKKDASCQVGTWTSVNDSNFLFFSDIEGSGSSTQCNIGANVLKTYSVSEKSSGIDAPLELCKGFHGFNSIKDETSLRELTSKSYAVFKKLLQHLPHQFASSISNEDSLLLYLMKLKLGLPFAVLGILFGVNRTTASRIFSKISKLLQLPTSEIPASNISRTQNSIVQAAPRSENSD